MPLQAIYQGRHRGGTIHADNGTGKPICINYEHFTTTANASKWVWVEGAVTCRHCVRLLKAELKPVVEQTLREKY